MGRIYQWNAVFDIVTFMEQGAKRAGKDSSGRLSQSCLRPRISPLREHRLQVTFKEGVDVLEVLFSVSPCGGYALEGFVEDCDDAFLLSTRGNIDFNTLKFCMVNVSTVAPFPLSNWSKNSDDFSQ